MRPQVQNSAIPEAAVSTDFEVTERRFQARGLIILFLLSALVFFAFNYWHAGSQLPGVLVVMTALVLLFPALLLSSKEKLLVQAESLILWFALISSLIIGLTAGPTGGLSSAVAFPFLALHLKGRRRGLQWSMAWAIILFAGMQIAAQFSLASAQNERLLWQAGVALLFYIGIALMLNRAVGAGQNSDEAAAADQGNKEKLAYLEQIAYHDSLTGLPNRLCFIEILDKEISLAQERGHSLMLAHIRLQRMFENRSIIGVEASDRLICNIVATMTAAVGSRGVFARVRRDEFVCVYRQHSEEINATEIIKEILAFRLEYKIDDFAVQVSHTIGVASFPQHAQDAVTLLHKAGQAMLQAQFANQNLAFYDEKQEQHFVRSHMLFSKLQEALRKNGLSLHYQAQVDLRSGTIIAAEALMRWIDPISGPVSAAEFIPIAEKSGLIKPLTLWAMREAFGQLLRWRAEGLNLSVAINIPARCIMEGEVVDELRHLFRTCNLPAGSVILELTEAMFTDTPAALVQIVASLHKMGFRLSIDDFGAAQTSLSCLKDLKIDELKIDQVYIRGMANDGNSRAIVQSTIQLAHNLNLRAVAEGVENPRTEKLLQDMACDVGQGFYFCKPMPADVFSQWARAWQINKRAALSA
ncbi:bifunctional diguanylate cyclase/phosphodiesterase [Undibacterium sp. TS12]|uniref:putative bifunctional diguanylate cyclase/phosphodiesterase n=1 Tax=Undibacterium sp. TS12 TaxID=2908202 RepID=UPI001F4C5669|nr:bifunctional diguanylate cyclase/phosphodiesterase [Undibacterium sp. TS12]MCH8621503.1 bifunctional diguanylate cyclase/phosphodiesterase [Undibacterium sp. TS12]